MYLCMLLYVEVINEELWAWLWESCTIYNQKDMVCVILSIFCFHSGCRTFRSVLHSVHFVVRNYYEVNEAHFVAVWNSLKQKSSLYILFRKGGHWLRPRYRRVSLLSLPKRGHLSQRSGSLQVWMSTGHGQPDQIWLWSEAGVFVRIQRG